MEINEILETAKSGLDLLNGGTSFVQQLRSLTQGNSEGRVSASEVKELTLNLQEKLIEAKQSQLDLLSALGEFQRQMMEVDMRQDLMERYEAFENAEGAFVLKLKDDEESDEPPHFICPDCAQDGRRSFLQPQGTGKRCNHHGIFFPFERPKPISRNPKFSYLDRDGW